MLNLQGRKQNSTVFFFNSSEPDGMGHLSVTEAYEEEFPKA